MWVDRFLCPQLYPWFSFNTWSFTMASPWAYYCHKLISYHKVSQEMEDVHAHMNMVGQMLMNPYETEKFATSSLIVCLKSRPHNLAEAWNLPADGSSIEPVSMKIVTNTCGRCLIMWTGALTLKCDVTICYKSILVNLIKTFFSCKILQYYHSLTIRFCRYLY